MQRDVVIVGYRLNAKEPAPRALERILGLAPEAARRLARSFPAVVGAALPEPQANQLAAQLRDAGAQVELREPGRSAQAAPTAHAAPRESAGGGARVPPPPAPAPPAAARRPQVHQVDEVDEDGLEANTVTAAYRLGDFGLAPPRPATPAAPAPAAPPSPKPPVAAPRAPGDDLSFDLDLTGGPELELEHAANSNARVPHHSEPPDLDDRFALTPHAAPAAAPAVPAVEERAYRAVQQRAARTSAHAPRRSSPLPAPHARPAPARAVAAVEGWLPSLGLLALLSLGTLVSVGYALDPDDAFALFSRRPALPLDAEPGAAQAADDDARHPLLRNTPSPLRAPLADILRARVAGVHALPTPFTGPGGKPLECMLVEQRSPEDDVRARLDELRRTGSEVAPPRAADAALREHARVLRASTGKALNLTPLCLAP